MSAGRCDIGFVVVFEILSAPLRANARRVMSAWQAGVSLKIESLSQARNRAVRLLICETEAVIAKLGREVCTISSRYRGVRRHFRGFQVIHGLFAQEE
mgnify:CR=1 FL=1